MSTERTPVERMLQRWGTRLRERRLDLNLSQARLADLTFCDQTTISRLERGEGVWSPQTMLTIAVALESRVERLFPWSDGIEELERYRVEAAGQRKVEAGAPIVMKASA